MAMTDIGKEYGAALFMLACELGEKKSYAEALEKVKKVFSEHEEYPLFIASPSVPISERLLAIESAFSELVPEHVLSYLLLLCEKGRMECFDESVKEYNALLDASERISNAKVTSAVELTEKEKEKLKNKLESIYKGEVHIEYFTDGALLGGLVVEVDGKIMDGSLRHRLREVKDVMNK